MEFIDAHYEAYEGPTLRDGMDQRVFNKFVMSHATANNSSVAGSSVCFFDFWYCTCIAKVFSIVGSAEESAMIQWKHWLQFRP